MAVRSWRGSRNGSNPGDCLSAGNHHQRDLSRLACGIAAEIAAVGAELATARAAVIAAEAANKAAVQRRDGLSARIATALRSEATDYMVDQPIAGIAGAARRRGTGAHRCGGRSPGR
jgi:hypothetical protein